jgi:oligopeptide transport system substrate-binding protein
MRALMHAKWVVGAGALSLALTACGSGTSDNAGSSGGGGDNDNRVVKAHGDPENPLIPTNTTETNGGEVIDALFTGLVIYNSETGTPENAMAESITPSEGNKKYTIKIKPGWKFHDGTEVKAKNFVDAWNYGANGKNAQTTGSFFGAIAGYPEAAGEDSDGDGKLDKQPTATTMSGLKVVDDTTFEVTLAAPSPTFAQRLGYTAFSPLPDSFFASPEAATAFGENPVGNGPFKFVKWEKGNAIEVARFADYTGPDAPSVEGIVYKNYTDPGAAYTDLLDNKVDLVDQIPTFALAGDKYKSDLGENIVSKAQGSIQQISAPLYNPKYKDPRISQAVSMAIDRDLIIKNIFNGTRVAADGWVSPVVAGFAGGACGEFCKYDPQKAKDLLAAAGGFSGTMTIAFNADAPTNHKAWVDAACIQIKNALGVDCQAKSYAEFGKMRADATSQKMTGFYRNAWQMDYPSIENFLEPLYSKSASSNDNKFFDPAFDAKLKEAQAATPEQALTLYQEAERMLPKGMPSIPLWFDSTTAGFSDRVANVKYNVFGEPDLSAITVK